MHWPAVTSPLHPAAGAGAGMSPWLGPGLHLKGDTAPSGLLFVGWRLPTLVQCPSVTLSHYRAFRLPGPVGAGASRQPSDELFDGLDSQVSGDDVVSDVPPGPRNQAERYILLGLETLALQSRAKGIPGRCSVGACIGFGFGGSSTPSIFRVQVRDGGLIVASCPASSRRGHDPDGSGGNGPSLVDPLIDICRSPVANPHAGARGHCAGAGRWRGSGVLVLDEGREAQLAGHAADRRWSDAGGRRPDQGGTHR
ncbi:hypothetical protein EVAR_83459_1 [Eumeta japonica]|uniref:Uncharacterized protein n=1 Tax=Eumeta variegata TaxID=151549 RepID=A0A4C1TZW6_EUMVA|nr:hypothetical protein EVAR_83459_1 [Eumeta japonica]